MSGYFFEGIGYFFKPLFISLLISHDMDENYLWCSSIHIDKSVEYFTKQIKVENFGVTIIKICHKDLIFIPLI